MSNPLSGLLEGDFESTASELGLDREVPESRRPALVRLCLDVESLVDELTVGFESREEVLLWARRMIPRTLGEVETSFYRSLAEQFRGAGTRRSRRSPATGVSKTIIDDRDRTLLAALLNGSSRTRALDTGAVEELRRDVATSVIDPAFRRAFRQLRKSATEYVDDEHSEESEHDPARQRYIAMRPALDELDSFQRRATAAVLEGLEDADQVRRWTTLVELATHGEIDDEILRRASREESTLDLLTSRDGTIGERRGRELFVAFYLLPAFNRGVRDLRNRAKEQPDAEVERRSAPMS